MPPIPPPTHEDTAAEALRRIGLVLRMAQGEQAALAELFDRCSGRVHALALRVLQRAEDAEEITLDTFSQAWERAPDYDPQRGEVLPWLLGMAWSRSIDRLRRERRHRRTEPLHPDVDEGSYAQAMSADTADLLWDRLDADTAMATARSRLTPAQQQMLALAFVEELSHGEIAERTGVPLGTVKSHLRRALERLAALLGGRGQRDD
ncbi:RNA polymerase sigma factor [Aquimonas voraii]|uniref:RNA polymerase sigma-70 factor, ECF subfamily n=1 Tax=Aquimonas voraii TaxID=265719 RepID=A0A1G6U142_9GAMM|nr:sigma-70 family RNA polymerase sigma factor [Aquimonas voraii]SDD34265.1 RNA polymerase sigma-70 factor, ECF subfamily [Aquimonas voraii]